MARRKRPGAFEGGRQEYENDPMTGMGGGTANGVSRQSGGTSGKLAIPGYVNETPVTDPYVPGQPAPTVTATQAAVAVAAERQHNAEARAAATKQRKLVSRYVTKAYSRKLKKKGVPAQQIGKRIEKAKGQLTQDRQRLLSNPTVKEANAQGKVLGPKSIRKVNRESKQAPPSTKDLFATPAAFTKGYTGKGRHQDQGDSPFGAIASAAKDAVEAIRTDPIGGDPGREIVESEVRNVVKAVEQNNDPERVGKPPTAEQVQALALIPTFKAGAGAGKVAASVGPGAVRAGRAGPGIARKIPQALRAVPGALREAPNLAKAGAKAAPGAAKVAAKKAPAVAGRAGKRGAETTYHSVGGLGLLGAASKGGLNVPGGSILEGQARALENDPGKVLSSTASIFPGLLVSALQLPVAAGKSAIEGNTAPLQGAVDEQIEFAKHFVDTYGGDDVAKIQKATEEEGLLPEILLAPLGKKLAGKAAKGLPSAASRAEARRTPAMDAEGNVLTHEHGGPIRKGRRKSKGTREREAAQHRREEARLGSTNEQLKELDAAARSHAVDKPAYKGYGGSKGKSVVVREGLGAKGKDKLEAKAPDFAPFLLNAHIDLQQPRSVILRELDHYAEFWKDHDPVADGMNPDGLTAQDAVKFFRENPDELGKPELQGILDNFRAVSNGKEAYEGLQGLSTSKRNEHLGPAVAHGKTLPEEMTPPEARPFTKAEDREGAWKDVEDLGRKVKALRREGRKKYDQAQAVDEPPKKGILARANERIQRQFEVKAVPPRAPKAATAPDSRQPFLYDPKTHAIYLGRKGTNHADEMPPDLLKRELIGGEINFADPERPVFGYGEREDGYINGRQIVSALREQTGLDIRTLRDWREGTLPKTIDLNKLKSRPAERSIAASSGARRSARLRREAKETYSRARALDKGRKKLKKALDPYTRPGAKANLNSERVPYTEQMEDQFAENMQTFYAERGLHPEGVYVPDAAPVLRATGDSSTIGGDKPLPGGPKINEGKNWRKGYAQQGFEHLKNEGLLRPINLQRSFEHGREFDVRHGIDYRGSRVHNGKTWGKALQYGIVHKEDTVFVPDQQMKRLERDVSGGQNTDHQQTLLDVEKGIANDPSRIEPGTKYRAYPKAAWEEYVAQAQKSGVARWLQTGNRLTSMTMLSTPAFLGAQVIAETMQGLASVNPLRQAEGLVAYSKLNWEQKLKISSVAGESSGMLFKPDKFHDALDAGAGSKQFADALSFWRTNLGARATKSLLTGKAIGELDRLKSSKGRRGVLTGEILRDLNGFESKARGLLNRHTELDKKMRGKTYAEQLAYVAENPDLLNAYQRDFHDMMGGWANLTRSGHLPESYRAAALIFYPFLRMSILWPFKYAGRHPLKATALAYLTAENNWALKEALEGEPSFLNYAQIPTWKKGEDGKPVPDAPIGAQRFGIGGNLGVQLLQGNGSLLQGFQPLISATILGLTGKGPLGEVGGGPLGHLEAVAGSILGLSPYVRGANTLRGQAASGESDYGILGERANLALDPLAAVMAKLKGSQGKQLVRNLLIPGLPDDLQHQRDYARLGRILTELGDTGSEAQSENVARKGSAKEQREVRKENEALMERNAKAEKELEKLYAKYGVSKIAARSEDVYNFTHPFNTKKEEGEGGIYGGQKDMGSIYDEGSLEGSIYGGGKEKPVPVPYKDNSAGISLPGLGGPLGAIASPLASLALGGTAQASELPKGLERKTAGSPNREEVITAGRAGTLKLNRHGKLTTPAVRKAAKELQRAEARMAPPKINGVDLPGEGNTFAQYLAKYTGLDPQFVGAWVKSEGGGSANGGEAGKNNWLGVGYPGEQTPFSQSPYFNGNAKRAAKATAEWMEGKIGHEYSYRAADGIQQIIPLAAGKGPQAALEAVAKSGWAGTSTSSTYAQHIAQNMTGVSVASVPGGGNGAQQALKVAKANARKLGLNPTPFNGDVEQGQGRTVTVRADAKGMVNWAKSAEGKQEGSPWQLAINANAGIAASEPWCAAFIQKGLERRGIIPPEGAAVSGNYANPAWKGATQIGTDLAKAKPGDLVIFAPSEHIGLYVGNGEMIAGNASDQVLRSKVADDGRPIESIARPKYRGGKIQIHESTELPGGTPAATFGGITPSGEVEAVSAASSATGKKKKGQKQSRSEEMTGTERLKLINDIAEGNLEGLGIPGYSPPAGPAVADLAALGKSLEAQRRKLARL